MSIFSKEVRQEAIDRMMGPSPLLQSLRDREAGRTMTSAQIEEHVRAAAKRVYGDNRHTAYEDLLRLEGSAHYAKKVAEEEHAEWLAEQAVLQEAG